MLLAWTTTTGCASYDALAVGEALAVADHRRAEPALAVNVSQGIGTSSQDTAHGTSLFMEWRGQALINTTRQQFGLLAGLSDLVWIGERTPLWIGLDFGLAAEHADDTLLFDAMLRGEVRTGFVLHETKVILKNLFGVADDAVRDLQHAPRVLRILRTRTLLTLGLVGDGDPRFTRDPLAVASFMIGLAQVVEFRTELAPILW